jgi:hypothetical protein
MISTNTYRHITNIGMIGVLLLLVLGFCGLAGCTIQGDTYSGVVNQPDCSNADSGGGQLNCGSGDNDDDHSEETPEEEE